jgi:hypothetical protein
MEESVGILQSISIKYNLVQNNIMLVNLYYRIFWRF